MVFYRNTYHLKILRSLLDPNYAPSIIFVSSSHPVFTINYIQLGLRGDAIAKYAREWILDIEDISDFVAQQRNNVINDNYAALITPTEHIYPVTDIQTAKNLELSSF